MSQDTSIDEEILVTDHTPQKERTSRPSSRNSSHKVLSLSLLLCRQRQLMTG